MSDEHAELEAFKKLFPHMTQSADMAACVGLIFGYAFTAGALHERGKSRSSLDADLIALCDGSKTRAEIAALLERSTQSVTARIIKLRKRGTELFVKSDVKHMRASFERAARVHEMRGAGKSFRQIGRELSLSAGRVSQLAKRHERVWLDASDHLNDWADHEWRKSKNYGWFYGWRAFHEYAWSNQRAHVNAYQRQSHAFSGCSFYEFDRYGDL